MLKCSSERWVCAPHSLSSGTSTTPRLSVSLRISVMVSLRSWRLGALSEREDVSAHSAVEELDLQGSVRDRLRLPDELVQARFLNAPPSVGVNVNPMIGAGRSAIELDAEADRAALEGRRQNEVKIAGVETVGDAAGRRV